MVRKIGSIHIEVLEGRNLIPMDSDGQSDPYCVILVGDKKKKTRAVRHTLFPRWEADNSFDFNVDSNLQSITVEVYDWDRFSSDDRMGLLSIPMTQITEYCVDTIRWYALSPMKPDDKVSGDIKLKIRFDKDRSQPQEKPLIKAIKDIDLNAIEQMISKSKIDYSLQDIEGTPAIHLAVASNSIPLINTLLKGSDLKITVRDQQGNSPLHFFAWKCISFTNCEDVVNKLIDRGCGVNDENQLGEIPLHKACLATLQKSTIIDQLIQRGSRINHQTKIGETPLHYSIKVGKLDFVRFLILNGADFRIVGGSPPMSPIELSRSLGFTSISNKIQQVLDISDWLNGLELESLLPVFIQNEIYMDVVTDLDESTLDSFKILSGQKTKLLRAIRKMKDPSSTSSNSSLRSTSSNQILGDSVGSIHSSSDSIDLRNTSSSNLNNLRSNSVINKSSSNLNNSNNSVKNNSNRDLNSLKNIDINNNSSNNNNIINNNNSSSNIINNNNNKGINNSLNKSNSSSNIINNNSSINNNSLNNNSSIIDNNNNSNNNIKKTTTTTSSTTTTTTTTTTAEEASGSTTNTTSITTSTNSSITTVTTQEPGPNLNVSDLSALKHINLDSDSWVIDESNLKYNVLLGTGASGKVYKGTYKGQEVAIKVLKSFTDQKDIAEFKKEFQIVSSLKAPGVVYFYGAGIKDKLCIVMEYCAKGSLYHILKDDTTQFNWDNFFHLGLQAISSLDSLHNWTPQVLHRDLKSLNLLVTGDWTVKICDFGLSRFDTGSNLETLGKLRGTYAYVAPEVYFGNKYTTKSDVYSMGMILWEMTYRCIKGSHQFPYQEYPHLKFDYQILISSAKKDVRPTIPVGTPQSLADLITKTLLKESSSRPTTSEFYEELLKISKEYSKNRDEWDSKRNIPIQQQPVQATSASSNSSTSSLSNVAVAGSPSSPSSPPLQSSSSPKIQQQSPTSPLTTDSIVTPISKIKEQLLTRTRSSSLSVEPKSLLSKK